MLKRFLKFLKEEEGIELIEYALMAALFAIALVGAITLLKGGVEGTFGNVSSQLPAGS